MGAKVGEIVGDLVGLFDGLNTGTIPVGGRTGDLVGLVEKATGDFVGVCVPNLVGIGLGKTTDTGVNVGGFTGAKTGAVIVGKSATDDGAFVGPGIAGDPEDDGLTGALVNAAGDLVIGKLTGSAGEDVVPEEGSFDGATFGVGTTFGDTGIRTGTPVGAIVKLGLLDTSVEGVGGLGEI